MSDKQWYAVRPDPMSWKSEMCEKLKMANFKSVWCLLHQYAYNQKTVMYYDTQDNI